jgi:LPS export ABC transporter protein LptC
LRRDRLKGALIAVVLLALVGLGFLLGRTLQKQRQSPPVEETGKALAPEVSQRIRDFRRVKVEDGRTVWELEAKEAEYHEDQSRIIVRHPKLSFASKGGETVMVTGAHGEVVLSDGEVGRIDLKGGIEVRLNGYVLNTPEASWIDQLDAIVAASGIRVQGEKLALTGRVMTIELAARRVRVIGEVTTVTLPQAGAAAPLADLVSQGAPHDGSR